jgi:hypothetical protein
MSSNETGVVLFAVDHNGMGMGFLTRAGTPVWMWLMTPQGCRCEWGDVAKDVSFPNGRGTVGGCGGSPPRRGTCRNGGYKSIVCSHAPTKPF